MLTYDETRLLHPGDVILHPMSKFDRVRITGSSHVHQGRAS
jgi:hypothetical protein